MKLSASGDGYEGEVRAESRQWLITSIPYDKNLEIYVDGARVETVQVNGGFAGTEISEGIHRVEIRYHAQGSVIGSAVSAGAAMAGAVWMAGSKIRKKYSVTEREGE